MRIVIPTKEILTLSVKRRGVCPSVVLFDDQLYNYIDSMMDFILEACSLSPNLIESEIFEEGIIERFINYAEYDPIFSEENIVELLVEVTYELYRQTHMVVMGVISDYSQHERIDLSQWLVGGYEFIGYDLVLQIDPPDQLNRLKQFYNMFIPTTIITP